MKHLLTALSIVSLTTAAVAQETLFTGPGGAVVQMNIETCPQNMMCVDAFTTYGDSNLSLMLPEWIDEMALISRSDNVQAAAYLKGLSDGYVVDICNDCQCCQISLGEADTGGFMPWSAAPQAIKTGPIWELSR
jgi:hypothetical protein